MIFLNVVQLKIAISFLVFVISSNPDTGNFYSLNCNLKSSQEENGKLICNGVVTKNGKDYINLKNETGQVPKYFYVVAGNGDANNMLEVCAYQLGKCSEDEVIQLVDNTYYVLMPNIEESKLKGHTTFAGKIKLENGKYETAANLQLLSNGKYVISGSNKRMEDEPFYKNTIFIYCGIGFLAFIILLVIIITCLKL